MVTKILVVVLLCSIGSGSAGKKVVKERARSASTESRADSITEPSSLYTLEIQQAIGKDASFRTRGIIQLSNYKSSLAHVTFDQEPLTGHEMKLLETAAANGDYYYLRTRGNFSDVDSTEANEDFVMTISSACGLLKSSLKDKLIIHGDGQGNIISISIMPVEPVLETGLNCKGMTFNVPLTFNTKVQYTVSKAGPVPQAQAFLQKQEAEKAVKETEDNRSFLQKYWLYIIIGLVAFQFLAMGGGAGGGGGGGS